MEMLEIFAYCTVAVVHFTDQNWITKTVYFIRCMMVCTIGFTNWKAKIALLRASMVVTYYIKLFRTGADRHNSILMSLLLLVAETIIVLLKIYHVLLRVMERITSRHQLSCKLNHNQLSRYVHNVSHNLRRMLNV